MTFKVIRKFAKLSAAAEKTAFDIYERLPMSLRYHLFFSADFFRWAALIRESDEWDRDRLNDYLIEQTKDLLIHAMKHIPYYRDRFSDAGFRPERIQSLEDLKVLPSLTKEDVARPRQNCR